MSKTPSIPPLPFRQVKASYYVSRSGAILPVNSQVDTETFKESVEAAIMTAGNVESCRKEVQELLLSGPLDVFSRWYVIDTIVRRGGRFPLYASKAEAEQAREERKVSA